jgi:hypothetical protein
MADISELYEQQMARSAARTTVSKISKTFSMQQVLLMGACIAAWYYIVYVNGALEMLPATMFLGVALFIIYVMNKQSSLGERKPLPERIIKDILKSEMEWKQQNAPWEVEAGVVRPGPTCNLICVEDKEGEKVPFRYQTACEIDKEEGGIETFVAMQDPYDGTIYGIHSYPEGFTGRESPALIRTRWSKDVLADISLKRSLRSRGGILPPP